MKNIRQPPMIHHCNQTEYIQRGASLAQMAADACAAMYLPDRMKKAADLLCGLSRRLLPCPENHS